MHVFVAGATGAIGKQLVPRLVAAGHQVHGMTRSPSKTAMLEEMGAIPVIADALDPDEVDEAVRNAQPDVIFHQLTAIDPIDLRHFDRDFAQTNRLRTEGTNNLLSAGKSVGVRRFVAQGGSSFGMYARTGGPVKTEEDPLESEPIREMSETIAAIRYLEEAVLDATWTEEIVLRYSALYGPGTSMASVAEWLPALAEALGARKLMHVPRFVGKLFTGEAGVVMMTDIRGASNAKAKRELGWSPTHRSWRQGFTSP
jgi:nucleoside-diphosphate-sugar epimerase